MELQSNCKPKNIKYKKYQSELRIKRVEVGNETKNKFKKFKKKII